MERFPENMYQERAMHCFARAKVSQDEQTRKYWDQLALEWIELEAEKLPKNRRN